MINVNVKFFAMARDIAKTTDALFSMDKSATTEQLLGEVIRRYPGLEKWKPYLRLAVNRSYANENVPLKDGDEVAIIPPVSGG